MSNQPKLSQAVCVQHQAKPYLAVAKLHQAVQIPELLYHLKNQEVVLYQLSHKAGVVGSTESCVNQPLPQLPSLAAVILQLASTVRSVAV